MIYELAEVLNEIIEMQKAYPVASFVFHFMYGILAVIFWEFGGFLGNKISLKCNKTKYINAKTDRPFSKEDFSLSSDDIDLITPLLNKHMQSLDRENECGYSLSTEYWELMLKLKRIKSVLEEQNDINKNGKAGKKE